ncbi:MAG: hypothetical protein ABI999_13050 [Acidobacteriota bacterium]
MRVNKRPIQFLIGSLTVLSLLVFSASACTCSNYEAAAPPEVSSLHHHHSEMSELTESHESHLENGTAFLASDDDCICAVTTQTIVAKFETVKIEKRVLSSSFEVPEIAFVISSLGIVKINFVKLFYLSDSFYNLAPKRGPPRL